MVKFEMVDGGDSLETNFKCWAIGATVEHLRFCQVRTFGVRAFAQGGEIRSARMNSGNPAHPVPGRPRSLSSGPVEPAQRWFSYIDFFAPLMISWEQRERPASHCLTEVCQLNKHYIGNLYGSGDGGSDTGPPGACHAGSPRGGSLAWTAPDLRKPKSGSLRRGGASWCFYLSSGLDKVVWGPHSFFIAIIFAAPPMGFSHFESVEMAFQHGYKMHPTKNLTGFIFHQLE